MSQVKRQNAAMLVLLVFFFSVFPVKRSEAIVPIAIGLTMQAFGAGGSVMSANLLTAGVTNLVGATIVALGLAATEMGDGTPPVTLRIPVATIDVEAAMPAPSAPPTTAAVVSGGAPANASTINAVWSIQDQYSCASTGGWCNGGTVSKLDVCLSNFAQSFSNRRCLVTQLGDANDGNVYGVCTGCNSPTSSSACPAGYSSSSGACSLVNARAAVSDSNADLTRSGAGYALATGEKDAVPSFASTASGKIYASGTNSAGKPVMIEYAVSPDGTKTYITHYTQSDAGGQSVVNSQAVTVDAATGYVTASASSAAQGSISGIGTGAVPVVSTGAAVTPTDLVFPSDYARTGEAANAANVVKTAIDALASPLTASEDVSDPTVPEYVDPWGVTFGSLKGWSLPGHTSTCPVGSFEWENRVFAFDTHCQLVSDHFGVLQVAMSVVWVVLALWVVLGA